MDVVTPAIPSTSRARDVLIGDCLPWRKTYETVKLMESGQHVSWSIVCPIYRDRVWIAEVVRFIIVESYISSCV